MRSPRAAEKRRIGIEISPKVRHPFQTEVAMYASPSLWLSLTNLSSRAHPRDLLFASSGHGFNRAITGAKKTCPPEPQQAAFSCARRSCAACGGRDLLLSLVLPRFPGPVRHTDF